MTNESPTKPLSLKPVSPNRHRHFLLKVNSPPIFELTLEEVVDKVRKNNPNLEQLRGLAEIQNLQIEMVKGDYFPVVFAGASVARIGQFDNLRDFSSTYWGNDSKIFGPELEHLYRPLKESQISASKKQYADVPIV